jgi:fatty-acyl-CoA synthase
MLDIHDVRPGCSTVVEVEGASETRLVALVEPTTDHPDLRVIAARIAETARTAAGVLIRECVFVSRGSLPKTPSGKIQLHRGRELASGPCLLVRCAIPV